MSASSHLAFRRAQLYVFFSNAFLYPRENWLEDLSLVAPLAAEIGLAQPAFNPIELALEDLQAEHRHCFGLVGSLCYETELGLPHEFRQSQEMADIAGFYRAFGFNVGGAVRERADHIATELEFLSVLALKEARAQEQALLEQVEICEDAQRKFLVAHVGVWVEALAEALRRTAADRPYATLAQWLVTFIYAEAARLKVVLEPRPLTRLQATPPPQPMACGECPLADPAAAPA